VSGMPHHRVETPAPPNGSLRVPAGRTGVRAQQRSDRDGQGWLYAVVLPDDVELKETVVDSIPVLYAAPA
jgi:hypothetical protein